MPTDNAFDDPIQVDLQPLDSIALLSYSRLLTTRDICKNCRLIEHGQTSDQSVCSLAKNMPRNEWPAVESQGEHGGHLVACWYLEEVDNDL